MATKKHNERFIALVNDAKTRIKEISLDELNQQRAAGEFMHLLDVREESEWDRGFIPGSEHLSRGILEVRIEKEIPDYNDKIVVYCGGGYRSALAADNLQKMGYTNVLSLIGGFRYWSESQ